jgi:hypothetical protein
MAHRGARRGGHRRQLPRPPGPEPRAKDGYVDLDDATPGLGLTVNLRALEQFDVLEWRSPRLCCGPIGRCRRDRAIIRA